MMATMAQRQAAAVEPVRSIDAIAEEWDELADRTGASPFARPGWMAAWVEAFQPRARQLILTTRDGDRLTGVLPLIGGRGRLRSPTNSHTPLFECVVEDDAAAAALVGELSRMRPRQLDLMDLDPAGPLALAWAEAGPAAGFRTDSGPQMRSPYVPLEGDFASHRTGLERRFRKDLDRRRRRLGELGDLSFSFGDGGDDVDALLDEGLELEASGWKLDAGTAILQRPAREQFYRAVARWARERGSLTLAFARLDGRAIAFDFCIEDGGRVYVLKGGYDPDYRKYGLGFLLIEATIERAYANGMESYELLGDADDYKLQLTSSVRERIQLHAFGRGPGGRARKVAYERLRPVWKRLRTA